jgi:tRNA threonylcarbamoyladenosine biosynthesis protein TsaB
MSSSRSTSTILAIDCSQREACLVLEHAGRVHARRFDPTAQVDREPLWDELRLLFADAGAPVGALGAIAVATGPGGFTGLRVAIGCAKGVAFGLGIPVVALPSPIVFAVSDRAQGGAGPWLVALAAKQDTVWAVEVGEVGEVCEVGEGEQAGGDGSRRLELGDPIVVGPDRFSAIAARVAGCGGTLLADEHLGERLTQVAAEAGLPIRRFGVDPAAFVREARARLEQGLVTDPLQLAPIYAREPEAVTKWRERADSARRVANGG